MIKTYNILNNIISEEKQNILEQYVQGDNLPWKSTTNITGEFGGKMYTTKLPGNVLRYEDIDNQINKIIEEIQINVCNSLNLQYLKTYRCKINHTIPVNIEYDPLDLIHIDMKMEHMVIVYYINDSDGDTVILENSNGIGMDNIFSHIDGVIKEDFKPIVSVKPTKGSVVAFNGNLYHYGDFPKNDDRFIINLDLAVRNINQTKIL